ncbi:MAG TPA: RICIN domain-containing protein, partial [Phytomonospora sp.]
AADSAPPPEPETPEPPPPLVIAPVPEPVPAPPAAVRPARPKRRPKPPRAPRPPKVRKPRRLPAWLTRRPALRLNAVPVRVFATALVVALALFAIGTLRDDGTEAPETGTAAQAEPELAPIPSQASPSATPSPSSAKPKPKDTPTKDDPTEDDEPPAGGGGGKAPKTGSFRIKSVSSGMCLDEADLGDSTVVQKGCSSSPLSARGLESLGGGDYYLTTNHPQHGAGCISSEANGVGNGFIGDACTGDAAQVFHLDEVADGVYRIRLVDNGTCVAVSGGGAPVSASCGSGKGQRFTFV